MCLEHRVDAGGENKVALVGNPAGWTVSLWWFLQALLCNLQAGRGESVDEMRKWHDTSDGAVDGRRKVMRRDDLKYFRRKVVKV